MRFNKQYSYYDIWSLLSLNKTKNHKRIQKLSSSYLSKSNINFKIHYIETKNY